MAVSFGETDWFRGLICSMIALGTILVGYATYYQILLPRWPDYNECESFVTTHFYKSITSKSDGDDEEDEDGQLTGKANAAYVEEQPPTNEKVEQYSETKGQSGVDFRV